MSNEKQFENIENKLKKALESGEHAFDEEAWAKMEALLDKDDKKRKPIVWFWLLPILLIGTLAIFKFIGNKTQGTSSNNTTAAVTEKKNPTTDKGENKTVIDDKKANEDSRKKSDNENVTFYKGDKIQPADKATNAEQNKNSLSNKDSNKEGNVDQGAQGSQIKATDIRNQSVKVGKKRIVVSGAAVASSEKKSALSLKLKRRQQKHTVKTNESVSAGITSSSADEKLEKDPVDKKANDALNSEISLLKESPLAIVQQKKDSVEKETIDKVKSKSGVVSKPPKDFYIVGGIGADAGNVKLLSFANSKMVPKYGLSVGYKFSRKWSLQTGFFISNKEYVAEAKDYHVKPGSYWSNYKITDIDAVCKVYEIPLSFRYDIANKRSFTYYVMAGISSYIMKREDYDYYYLNPWGIPMEKPWQYTGNKHLFSNANISFGIEKKLSKLFSLQLEPTVSVPVKGVGEGKVNLYSTSVMLGIKYLPFKK